MTSLIITVPPGNSPSNGSEYLGGSSRLESQIFVTIWQSGRSLLHVVSPSALLRDSLPTAIRA